MNAAPRDLFLSRALIRNFSMFVPPYSGQVLGTQVSSDFWIPHYQSSVLQRLTDLEPSSWSGL
jgi:hypothetical protein